MASKSTDAVIIGAGIIGCSVAYALAKRGLKVVLLDAANIGQGTSSKSFTWINAASKSNDQNYFKLNAQGLNMYRALVQQWGAGEVGVHQSGMLNWAKAGDDSMLKALRNTADTAAAWGYSIRSVDHKTLRKLEPNVRFSEGSEGYLADNDCWLDVPVYLHFLRREIKALGGKVMEHCPALELLADDDGKVLGVATEKGQISCSKVVVATGVDTPQVLSQLTGYEGFSTRFPVQRGPGLLVYTPAITPVKIKHVLYPCDANGLHIRPTRDGGLLLGADDTDGIISESSTIKSRTHAVKILLQRAQQIIPEFAGVDLIEQCRSEIGIRVVPADERSIAGPMLSAEGLYIVVTHSGISLAPVLGKLIADCIEDNAVSSQLQPFSLDRFDR